MTRYVPGLLLGLMWLTPLVAQTPRLSPDGEYIAALVDTGGTNNLVTTEISGASAKAITAYSDASVSSFFWVNDNRLVFSIAQRSAATEDGAEPGPMAPAHAGSYTILRDGSGGRKLQEQRGRRGVGDYRATGTAPQLLHRLPNRWNEVLVSRVPAFGVFPEVFLLDVETGRSRKIVPGMDQVNRWIVDNRGVVRAAIDKGEDVLAGNHRLLYRAGEDDEWREIRAYRDGEFDVLGFHADNRRLVVLAPDRYAKLGLFLMEPTGVLDDSLLIDPEYGLAPSPGAAGLMQTSYGYLIAYQYAADGLRTVYFDARWESRQQAIDEALADTVNTIVNWSDDERQLLVQVRSDGATDDYYLFDTTYKELSYLQPPATWLE